MCGIFGIVTPDDKNILQDLYYGLYTLQHRGQEACGISVLTGTGGIQTIKNEGLVGQVLGQVKDVTSHVGIGHVRYATAGNQGVMECMPMTISGIHGPISYVFNGTLVEYNNIKRELHRSGIGQFTSGDSELIGQWLCKNNTNILETLQDFVKQVKAAYSIIIMTQDGLYIIRDRYAFRPLWITQAQTETGKTITLASSETCAFGVVLSRHGITGLGNFREVSPGEIVHVNQNGMITSHVVSAGDTYHPETNRLAGSACLFEWVYFSRPDSIITSSHEEIQAVRERIGSKLYAECPCDCDVVVGVPDSGVPFAIGYSEASGIPYKIGFTKNRYIARTFIDDNRDRVISSKYIPLKCDLSGKRVCLVDDSIVRGHTIKALGELLRGIGCKEVHVRIGYPPVKQPCYMGINMKTTAELIANTCDQAALCDHLGIDSLGFISIDGLKSCVPVKTMCTGCLDGDYGILW